MRADVPVADRPGVQLDHRFAVKVHVVRDGRPVHVGYFDPRHRTYQWGGALSTHVFWKLRVLALGPEECAALKRLEPPVEWLEFVDMGSVCYRIPAALARESGWWFDGPAGRRFGIPLDSFERIDVES